MKRRIVAVAAILFLVISDISCLIYSTRRVLPDQVALRKVSRREVLAVMKKSKEFVEFSANQRGRISRGQVTGLTRKKVMREIEIPGSKVARIEETGEDSREIITTDGKRYALLRVLEKENRYVAEMDTPDYLEVPVSIPLSEVEMLWIRGVDPLKTSLVALGVVGAVAGVIWGGLVILFLASGGFD